MIRHAWSRAVVSSTLVLAAVCLARPAAAQGDDFLELLRSDLKTDKVALLTEVMEFTPEQANIFWPLYREYDLKLSKLGDDGWLVSGDAARGVEASRQFPAARLVRAEFIGDVDPRCQRAFCLGGFEQRLRVRTRNGRELGHG